MSEGHACGDGRCERRLARWRRFGSEVEFGSRIRLGGRWRFGLWCRIRLGFGFGVGSGVGLGVGSGVGPGVGSGVGLGVGSEVGPGVSPGSGVGSSDAVGAGSGVGSDDAVGRDSRVCSGVRSTVIPDAGPHPNRRCLRSTAGHRCCSSPSRRRGHRGHRVRRPSWEPCGSSSCRRRADRACWHPSSGRSGRRGPHSSGPCRRDRAGCRERLDSDRRGPVGARAVAELAVAVVTPAADSASRQAGAGVSGARGER